MLFKIFQQPFFKLLIPFLSGTSTFFFISNANVKQEELLAALLLMALICLLIFSIRSAIQPLIVFISLYLIGYSAVSIHHDLNNKNHFSQFGGDQVFSGAVKSPIKYSYGQYRCILNITNVYIDGKKRKVGGNLLCNFKGTDSISIAPGDVIQFRSSVNRIKSRKTDNGFNPGKYYQSKNTYFQTYCEENNWLVINKASDLNILSVGLKIKDKVLQRLEDIHSNNLTFQITAAILTGYTAGLDQKVRTAFGNSGVMHVLCVSGLHTGLVFTIVAFFLKLLFRFNYVPKYFWLTALVPIWIYALTTGFSPSVCRASLMLSFYTIGTSFSKSVSPINILSATCFVLLIIDPFFLLNIGFQLSFLAVSGILIIYPKVHKLIRLDNTLLKYLWSLISISIAAQIITTPICIAYFGYTPVNFIAGNIIALPLTTVLLYTSVVLLPLSSISIISSIYQCLSNEICEFLNKSLDYLGNMPFSVVNIESLPWWLIILFYLFLIWLLLPISNRLMSSVRLIIVGISCYIIYHTSLRLYHDEFINLSYHHNGYKASSLKVSNGYNKYSFDFGEGELSKSNTNPNKIMDTQINTNKPIIMNNSSRVYSIESGSNTISSGLFIDSWHSDERQLYKFIKAFRPEYVIVNQLDNRHIDRQRLRLLANTPIYLLKKNSIITMKVKCQLSGNMNWP